MVLHRFKFGTAETGRLIVASAKFSKKRDTISKMDIVLQSTLTTFNLDDEAEFFDQSSTLKFKGTITKIKEENTLFTLELKDLGYELTTERFSDAFRNQRPEQIIQSIVETYTDLTFSTSLNTGFTIPKQIFRDDLLIDGIIKMMELFNGAYTIDKAGVFTLMRKFETANSNSIVSGQDVLQGGWNIDSNKKFTKIIVEGGNINQRTTETISGTGTVFNTTFIPKDIQIGTLTQTTDNINGDYEVDEQNKQITFNNSITNPMVSYTYESQVRVEMGQGKTLKLQKSYIETTNDALKLALTSLNLYQNGISNANWLKSDNTDFENYNTGESITVIDSVNDMSGTYEIAEVTYTYPNRLVLKVGEDEDQIFDWQKETQQRIQELEQKDQNGEFVTRFNYNNNIINIRVTSAITSLQTVGKGDAWILNDPVNSQIDSTFRLDGGTITNLI